MPLTSLLEPKVEVACFAQDKDSFYDQSTIPEQCWGLNHKICSIDLNLSDSDI